MADHTTRRITMVDTQVRPSDVTKFPIINAMLSVPREAFVPDGLVNTAYIGEHLDLGGGRTMLDPRTFAKMVEAVDIAPNHVVLDVACGLGYSTAVLAKLCDFVVGLEDDDVRVEEAQANLSENGVDNAAVMSADLTLGAPKSGPYDVIVIEGGVETLSPDLTEQLQEGGQIVCVMMEGQMGSVRVGHKIDGALSWRFAFNATAPILSGFEKTPSFVF